MRVDSNVVWPRFRQRSYTLEASLAGCIKEGSAYHGLHFNIQHFESMGRLIGPALLDMLHDDTVARRQLVAPLMDGIRAHRQVSITALARRYAI